MPDSVPNNVPSTPSNEDPNIVSIILADTANTREWDLDLPSDKPVQSLIAKFVKTPQLGFRAIDDMGTPIPYRLHWMEGGRYLQESETLAAAKVQTGHRIRMVHEARAGSLVI